MVLQLLPPSPRRPASDLRQQLEPPTSCREPPGEPDGPLGGPGPTEPSALPSVAGPGPVG